MTASEPDALAILEKHITAIGGREALKAIKNVETQIEREVLGATNRVYRLEERATGRFYTLTDGPSGKIEQGFDGKRAWRKAPYFRGYLPDSDPQARAATTKRHPLYEYKESGQVFTLAQKDKEYLVLSSEESDPLNRPVSVSYYFDPQTYLLKQTVRGSAVTQKTIFSDYRKVDGKMVAFLTTIVTPQATIIDRLVSIKYNVPLDASKFEYNEAGSKVASTDIVGATLPEVERIKTFELVWQTINDTYWDTSFGGVDWRGVHDKYLQLIKEAAANKDFYRQLNQMVGELNKSHFRVTPKEDVIGLQSSAAELRRGTTGLDLRWIDNQLLVVDVDPDSPARDAGVRRGFAVVRIANQTSDELLAEYREKTSGFPLREGIERVRSAHAALNGPPESKVSVVFLDDKSQLRPIEVTRKTSPLSLDLRFESKRLNQNTGYIRFNVFSGDLFSKFSAAIRDLRSTESIIIDLRGNPGGAGQLAPAIASFLSERDGSLGRFKFRYETQRVTYKGTGDVAYKGRVIILVDELSGSTSEVFAGGLQASGRATIIGTTTAGAVLPSLRQILPTGGALQYVIANYETEIGTVLEGRGVIPNIKVQPARDELLAGRDIVLERAIQAKNIAPGSAFNHTHKAPTEDLRKELGKLLTTLAGRFQNFSHHFGKVHGYFG